MKIPAAFLIITAFAFSFGSCKSSGPPVFCDTTCVNDTIKFNYTHPDNPFVYLSVKGCHPDTIIWSHDQLATKRKMGFVELVGKEVTLNKDYTSSFFKDTSYAWLKFNDCITGRGFLLKLPYSKDDKWSVYTSALNNFDPKYNVEEGLVAYYNETTFYVQELETGKVERLKISDNPLKIDHNKVHKTFDSIHVTRNRIYVKLVTSGDEKPLEKTITL